ncbi:MAG TPA: ribonuclease H-like domain-containing protein [Myxococcales bacterium]|nr:ribonuclease H-like domain-containing protein [Myxococcales bacterium]
MITASFRHIRGIGPLRERQLWFSGIRGWADLPGEGEVLSPRLDGKLRQGVAESSRRLAEGDLEFFARALPQTEHWRLLPQVISGAAFLDIEAAGDKVTVAGVLDAQGLASFSGDLARFRERSRSWRALVTFNGTVFDLPILRRVLPGWIPPAVHVDLRHVYQRLREKGGLKELEPRCGFIRPPHLATLSGADAVALWQAQCRGDRAALRRLVEYNLYDVFHLRPLAELGYNRLLQRTRMPAAPLPVSDRGAMLYDVSLAVAAACP